MEQKQVKVLSIKDAQDLMCEVLKAGEAQISGKTLGNQLSSVVILSDAIQVLDNCDIEAVIDGQHLVFKVINGTVNLSKSNYAYVKRSYFKSLNKKLKNKTERSEAEVLKGLLTIYPASVQYFTNEELNGLEPKCKMELANAITFFSKLTSCKGGEYMVSSRPSQSYLYGSKWRKTFNCLINDIELETGEQAE